MFVSALQGSYLLIVLYTLFAPLRDCHNLDLNRPSVMLATVGYSLPLFTWAAAATLFFRRSTVGNALFGATLAWTELFVVLVGLVFPSARVPVPACVDHGPGEEHFCNSAVIVTVATVHMVAYELRELRMRRRRKHRALLRPHDITLLVVAVAYFLLGVLSPIYLGVFLAEDVFFGVGLGLFASSGALAVFYHFIEGPVKKMASSISATGD